MTMTTKQLKRVALMGAMFGAIAVAAPAQAGEIQFPETFIQQLQTHKTMAAMDMDGDHKVTRKEFMHMQEELFKRMDRNNNGVVDEEEWMQLIFYSRG
jgi:Ca2+-binding EF-hand superfamily protein